MAECFFEVDEQTLVHIRRQIEARKTIYESNELELSKQTKEIVNTRIGQSKFFINQKGKVLGVPIEMKASDVYKAYAIKAKGYIMADALGVDRNAIQIRSGNFVDHVMTKAMVESVKLFTGEITRTELRKSIGQFIADAAVEENILDTVNNNPGMVTLFTDTITGLWAEAIKIQNDINLAAVKSSSGATNMDVTIIPNFSFQGEDDARPDYIAEPISIDSLPTVHTQLFTFDSETSVGGYADIAFIFSNGTNMVIDVKTKLTKYNNKMNMLESEAFLKDQAPLLSKTYDDQLRHYAKGMLFYNSKTVKAFILPFIMHSEYDLKANEFTNAMLFGHTMYSIINDLKRTHPVIAQLNDDDDAIGLIEAFRKLHTEIGMRHRISVMSGTVTQTTNSEVNDVVGKVFDFVATFENNLRKSSDFALFDRTLQSRVENYKLLVNSLVNYAEVGLYKDIVTAYIKSYAVLKAKIAGIDMELMKLKSDGYTLEYPEVQDLLTQKIKIGEVMRLTIREGEMLVSVGNALQSYAKTLTDFENLANAYTAKTGNSVPYTKPTASFTDVIHGDVDKVMELILGNKANAPKSEVRDTVFISMLGNVVSDMKTTYKEFDPYSTREGFKLYTAGGKIIVEDLEFMSSYSNVMLEFDNPIFQKLREIVYADRVKKRELQAVRINHFFSLLTAYREAMFKSDKKMSNEEAEKLLINLKEGTLIKKVSPEFEALYKEKLLAYEVAKDGKTLDELFDFVEKYLQPTKSFYNTYAKRESEVVNKSIGANFSEIDEVMKDAYPHVFGDNAMSPEELNILLGDDYSDGKTPIFNQFTISQWDRDADLRYVISDSRTSAFSPLIYSPEDITYYDSEGVLETAQFKNVYSALNETIKAYRSLELIISKLPEDQKPSKEQIDTLKKVTDKMKEFFSIIKEANDYRYTNVSDSLQVFRESFALASDLGAGYFNPLTEYMELIDEETVKKAKANNKNVEFGYMELNNNAAESHSSEEYKKIKNHPEAIALLDYLYAVNAEAGEIYDKKVAYNFLPDYSRQMIDTLMEMRTNSFSDTMRKAGKLLLSDFRTNSQDTMTGVAFQEATTHRLKMSGMQPLIDADGEIYTVDSEKNRKLRESNAEMKHLGLANIIPAFLEGISEYEILQKSEAVALSLLDMVADEEELKIVSRDPNGRPMWTKQLVPYFQGNTATGNTGTILYNTLNDAIKFHYYGIRYSGKGAANFDFGPKAKTFLPDIATGQGPMNTKKATLTMMKYYSRKILGFGIIPGTGALVAGVMSGFINSFDNGFMTKMTYKQALKLIFNSAKDGTLREKIDKISMAYNTLNQSATTRIRERKGNHTWAHRLLSDWGLYLPYHLADNILGKVNTVAVAMAWGIDKGQLVRMDKASEGVKSVWDTFTFDKGDVYPTLKSKEEKDVALLMERYVKTANQETYGQLSEDELMRYQTTILGTMLGMFKSWLPQLWYKRFRRPMYDRTLKMIRMGRYRAFYSAIKQPSRILNEKDPAFQDLRNKIAAEAEVEWENAIQNDGNTILKTMLHMLADTGTLLVFNMDLMFNSKNLPKKVHEDRIKSHFIQWMYENPQAYYELPGDSHDEKYQMYKETMLNNIRAGIVEFQLILLTSVAMLAMKGDWDDDGTVDAKEYYATRQLYKVLSKAQSELMFFVNPMEIVRNTKNAVPVLGLLSDVTNTVINTVDSFGDLTGEHVFGQKQDKRDKTPPLYYTSRWVPGVYQMRKLLEVFDQDAVIFYKN